MKRPLYPAKPTRCRCGSELWKGQCHSSYCPRYLRGNRLPFKAGSRVVVKRYPRAVRTVVQVYTEIPGGRCLDRPVNGFTSWNVSDLRRA